jgi:predicted transposase YdaD
MYNIYDQLWKGLLEDFSVEALQFFFPNAKKLLDLNAPIEPLDKELDEIIKSPQQQGGSIKYVDKLLKVSTRAGKELWILVHIEVQGRRDKIFAARMYEYHIRIKERYKKEVAALAIFTDNSPSFRPDCFRYAFMGTSMEFRYPIYKVLDQDIEKLLASKNPFATVILTVLLALKEKRPGKSLVDIQLKIAKNLYEKGYPIEKADRLIIFIQRILYTSEEESRIFETQLETITHKKIYPMGIKEQVIQIAEEVGEAKGKAKGKAEGKAETQAYAIPNMHKMGISISDIAKAFGISEKEVQKFLSQK